jgi:hypothetical protein
MLQKFFKYTLYVITAAISGLAIFSVHQNNSKITHAEFDVFSPQTVHADIPSDSGGGGDSGGDNNAEGTGSSESCDDVGGSECE